MNYYKVVAIAGHNGSGRSSDIVFAIEAETTYDAMQIVRSMPTIKHTNPRAIKSVALIDKSEFDKLRKESAYHRK